MTAIKIRFVKNCEDFYIQRKTIFGWTYITYSIGGGSGDTVDYRYTSKSKEALLSDILERYYKKDKRFVKVTEYPTILIY